jgi:arginine N-succinyltransferase
MRVDMKFIIRNAQLKDIRGLYDLASQFSLLNLPADRKVLTEKVEKSIASFQGGISKKESEYLFVLEDTENDVVVGSSLILAKHGTEDVPHYYFKIQKKDMFSQDLGIGFIHQVLQLKEDTNGPTEIGGLLIDRAYRRRPEKLGRQISLVRFLYMGMFPHEFEKRVLCELTPPLGEGGRSEFWEALGRRFTGLPYQEADLISQQNKEFISSLFPFDDIHMALLDSKARLVIGRVGLDTRPAQHLLEKMGFVYLNEVDPFDGGPHYGADVKDITIVREGRWMEVGVSAKNQFGSTALLGFKRDTDFRAVSAAADFVDGKIVLPQAVMRPMEIEAGEKVFVYTNTKDSK